MITSMPQTVPGAASLHGGPGSAIAKLISHGRVGRSSCAYGRDLCDLGGDKVRPHTLKVRLAAVTFAGFALTGCAGVEEQEVAAVQKAGDTWLLVEQGDRVLEDEKKPAVVPEEEHEPEMHGLELPELEKHEVEPADVRCHGSIPAGRIAPLQVKIGATTATLTWHHSGDPTVTSYQVTSIAQELTPGEQRELEWKNVEPGEECGELTATVTGLERDSAYVFSVDAVRQATWQNTARTATVARSEAVRTS